MATEKQNEFVFCGTVNAVPEFQFTDKGTAKGKLEVKRMETWSNRDGSEGSKEIILSFSFFGKPAEEAMNANLLIGASVRVTGSFGSWAARNKDTKELTGVHYADLKAFRVDVRSEQNTAPKPSGGIDF